MLIWNKLREKAENITLYFILLVLALGLMIFTFSAIYFYVGVADPLKTSISIFFDVNTGKEFSSLVYKIIIIEKLFKELFIAIFLGVVISKFIEKSNPIYLSDYVTYSKKDNKMVFRDWVMLPAGKYLYDVSVNISVITLDDTRKGKSRTVSRLDVSADDCHLHQLRGVWEIIVSRKSYDTPNDIITAMKSDENLQIRLIVRGTDEKGRICYAMKFYKLKDILDGCEFVPIRSTDFLKEEETKEFFRYQNFNKVYIPDDDAECTKTEQLKKEHNEIEDDILTKEEVETLQFCAKGIDAKMSDLFSAIFRFIYNPPKEK